MNSESLMKAINELPEEKQKEVRDFVAFLKQKTGKKSEGAKEKGSLAMPKDFSRCVAILTNRCRILSLTWNKLLT